nr:MAG TPA: hypothetical protein [Caudoviricetes sp.]
MSTVFTVISLFVIMTSFFLCIQLFTNTQYRIFK